MNAAMLSIRFRNLYGNIGAGCCLLALGAAHAAAPTGPVAAACAILLLALAGLNLRACLSRSRERTDEMAEHNAGRAAARALWVTLAVAGIACAAGLAFDIPVDLASAACVAIGFALVVYGGSFAWFERGE